MSEEEAVSVTRKGQVTIPKKFRNLLNIREGTKLLISQNDNSLVMRPLLELEELAGVYADKMMLFEAQVNLDQMRKQDRY
ncbi:MAG: AbrB/MazE/SpoVT family DNA-binding domain-containing protein [Thaumarchaeota archaeon]|nr:AbrB/MazE/SpoVT family DNA-binding domain-containing protein [Nitrososphaerota archaeon]